MLEYLFLFLPILTLRLAAIRSCTIRLAYLISHLGPGPIYSCMHYQECCLCILRLTAYLFSGSLLMYSQAHCLSSLRLTAYLVSSSLPMYSQAHCLCILRLTAMYSQAHCYVFSGSLPMYSQVHCLSILKLTVYLVSGSLSI